MPRLHILAFALLASCATPQEAGPYSGQYLIATADSRATDAGAAILARGGSAVDAAVAVQAVLGLVEPQSSGLGGGAFLVYRDAKTGDITTYDGRETAPAATEPDQFLDENGEPKQFFDAIVGGKSVGVPGAMAMLGMAHKEHGALAWRSLFDDGIRLAEDGFRYGETLNFLAARFEQMKDIPSSRAYFYDAEGNPWAPDSVIENYAYADTLRALARNPRALNEGPIAEAISVAAASAPRNPQAITLADLASYEPKVRAPVCGPYRRYTVCGMGPPSGGGTTVLQILGMLDGFDLASLGPGDPQSWHLIVEAERLAYADRGTYLADADFVDVPLEGLLDKTYIRSRAELIHEDRTGGVRAPGTPPHSKFARAPALEYDLPSTSHFTIVDGDGNVVSMTTSIEYTFGSEILVNGFLLNNQLTDFAEIPEVAGKPVANAAAPGKRPLSSMSPTIVLDEDGELVMAIGSPGGIRIIGYVVKTLVGVLDWNMTIEQAVAFPTVLSINSPKTEVETGAGADAFADALRDRGHDLDIHEFRSGLAGFRVTPTGYDGAADPRREGTVASGTVERRGLLERIGL